MPRNGAGTYNPPASSWNPGVNGVLATTNDWNGLLTDMSAAITQSVSADGQTPMTGPLPMGNNKITGLANGTAVTDAAAYGQILHSAGQCRLTKSGANLVLSPFNGNQIVINGVFQTVPAAGVTLAPGAFVAGTLYYIYAYMVGAVMTLEGSTTGHSTDVTTGVEIKTGDSTRSLVGMARPIAGPLWQDSVGQRFVVSWFNQRSISLTGVFTAVRGYSSATYGEVNSEIRNEFLTWSTNAIVSAISGDVSHSNSGSQIRTAVGLDGSLQDGQGGTVVITAGQIATVNAYFVGAASEGYHYTTLLANNISGVGTAQYGGSGTPGNRVSLQTTIQG